MFGILLVPVVLAQDVADRIWSGGPVLTMNDAAMRAEAVAEKDDDRRTEQNARV